MRIPSHITSNPRNAFTCHVTTTSPANAQADPDSHTTSARATNTKQISQHSKVVDVHMAAGPNCPYLRQRLAGPLRHSTARAPSLRPTTGTPLHPLAAAATPKPGHHHNYRPADPPHLLAATARG